MDLLGLQNVSASCIYQVTRILIVGHRYGHHYEIDYVGLGIGFWYDFVSVCASKSSYNYKILFYKGCVVEYVQFSTIFSYHFKAIPFVCDRQGKMTQIFYPFDFFCGFLI